MDSLAKAASALCIDYMAKARIDTATVVITSHPAAWLLKKRLLSATGSTCLLFSSDSTVKNTHPVLDIWINDFGVLYAPIPGESNLLQRESRASITIGIKSKSNNYNDPKEISAVITDTLDRSQLDFVESSPYPFTKSPVPPPERTFFEKIAEPAIIFTTALVTVILLFTVRSK